MGTASNPQILYHYTSMDGFLGIIENKSLHATNALFLNDRTEINAGLGIIRDKLHQMVSESGVEKAMAQSELEWAKRPDVFYVACFSEISTSANQWIQYADKGRGVALGFRRTVFKVGTRNTRPPQRVIYSKGEFKDSISQLAITAGMGVQNRIMAGDDLNDPEIANTRGWICEHAPLFKDSSFAAEQEWRIVHRMEEGPALLQKFRAGRRYLKPYVDLRFGEQYPLVEVIIGPLASHELGIQAARMILAANGFGEVAERVDQSKVPLR